MRGKRIFNSMFAHYKYLALVDTGAYDAQAAEIEARRIGEKLGLEYRKMYGTLDHLRQLLRGEWTTDRFVIIPSNTEVMYSDCCLKEVPMRHIK